MTDKKTEALKLALKKAFDLGQRYWQQADSDFTSQWRKADVTLASFNQLVEDTIREALAEQPAQQQEPVAYSYTSRITGAQGFSHHPMPRFIDADSWEIKPLYTSPPASKPWLGLTKDEVWDLWNAHTEPPFPEFFVDFKRSYEVIEAKLKEKNT